MRTLNKRMFLSFMIISFAIIFSISFTFRYFIEKSFNSYIESCNVERMDEIARSLSYAYSNDTWNKSFIEEVALKALDDGLIISIHDNKNNLIWSTHEEHRGRCESMMKNAFSNKLNNGMIRSSLNITKNGEKIGNVHISHYGAYYRDVDTTYYDTLNKVLIIITIMATILSLIISLILSKSINKPIYKVIDTVKLLGKGKYKERVDNSSSIVEIQDMIESINIMAKRLDSQDAMRKRLTKDIAHELRTPITIILGQLEAIKDGIWEPTEERLNGIYEEIQRIDRLVNSLNSLSKIEEENGILHKEKVEISELIENIFINFEKELHNKNIDGQLHLSKCEIEVDKDKISGAIINLISNALRYTENGGSINIKTFVKEDHLFIEVEDTGIGIAKEDIPYVFERFYRTDESRARVTGGAGIGLSITLAIVEAHNGTVYVKSELGKGSKFIIELPLNS
ncbi:MAG: HAMP domain-containing sensor histidine kinase [Clostridium sp.]|nr:HAMP domain-containing sensor histidine kinase [Clostridium sp.]MDU1586234.1 HAMP domain-containing sensor histidine kinase [Clostridium sp.]MDU1979222.1 HAMP domain-containing sensor histidine kinase [Clostridium sp.]MDU6049230.1 HAMP domain-containing sensor histidine kinase [Clostridium sp.]MDU6222712.1 HAMP domain-containing sensor histidine kinase [Clostridium sp.]MDU6272752.1 HAMP domain-containing sensor histidine kinase [Clostridium sp.]